MTYDGVGDVEMEAEAAFGLDAEVNVQATLKLRTFDAEAGRYGQRENPTTRQLNAGGALAGGAVNWGLRKAGYHQKEHTASFAAAKLEIKAGVSAGGTVEEMEL